MRLGSARAGAIDVDDTALRRRSPNLICSLDAILRARSLTDAGRRIHVGQPTMRGALGRLRQQFGDPLVSYSGAEPRLPALAQALRPKVRQLLHSIDDSFRMTLTFDPATARRSFRIVTGEALESRPPGRVTGAMLMKRPSSMCRSSRQTPAHRRPRSTGDVGTRRERCRRIVTDKQRRPGSKAPTAPRSPAGR